MAILARWLMSAGYAVDLAEEGATRGEALANADIALAIIAPEGWRRGEADPLDEFRGHVRHLITDDRRVSSQVGCSYLRRTVNIIYSALGGRSGMKSPRRAFN